MILDAGVLPRDSVSSCHESKISDLRPECGREEDSPSDRWSKLRVGEGVSIRDDMAAG